MFRIVSPKDAAGIVHDGVCAVVNLFLVLSNSGNGDIWEGL